MNDIRKAAFGFAPGLPSFILQHSSFILFSMRPVEMSYQDLCADVFVRSQGGSPKAHAIVYVREGRKIGKIGTDVADNPREFGWRLVGPTPPALAHQRQKQLGIERNGTEGPVLTSSRPVAISSLMMTIENPCQNQARQRNLVECIAILLIARLELDYPIPEGITERNGMSWQGTQ